MGVLKPSGNGLYLLPHQSELPPSPTTESSHGSNLRVALTAHCDPILWHRRFGHLYMQSTHAHHTHDVPTSPSLAGSVKNVSCDSCLLHKANAAPRNITTCAKPSRPLLNMSSDIWGPLNVPSPHGLHYCVLVIHHHTYYMWVLDNIMSEICHLHARHDSQLGDFAPVFSLIWTMS
jgi:hypothetical protein